MTIGERIKNRRIELGMSQDELAHLVGYTSRSTINKIEINANNLRQTKIAAIANALKVSPMYLMGWEEPEESSSIDVAASLFKEDDPILTELADVYSQLSLDKREQLLKIAKALL